MKPLHTAILCILCGFVFVLAGSLSPVAPFDLTDSFGRCPEALRRLALNSEQSIFESKHLWVRGASLSVNSGVTNAVGFNDLFSPPFYIKPSFVFLVNGKPVSADRYQWQVGDFWRCGMAGDVQIESLLAPASDARGMVLAVRLLNRGAADAKLPLSIELQEIAMAQYRRWTFSLASAGEKDKMTLDGESDAKRLIFTNPAGAVALTTDLSGAALAGKKWTANLNLKPGQSLQFNMACAVGSREEAIREASRLLERPEEVIAHARAYWNDQIEGLYTRLPRLKSDNRPLVLFYERSLLSVPLCRWQLPGLVLAPYYPTCGLDSGAFCAYVWDYAYSAQILPLCDAAAAKAHLRQFLKSQPTKHYAFSPFDGEPLGPHYSYNQYSIVRGIYYYVAHTGDTQFLSEMVDGKKVLDHVIEQATFNDQLSTPVCLIDYGDDHNLLELRRTKTYNAFVPSPNAERCWSYRAADKLAALAGKPSPNLSKRADALAALLCEKLWQQEQGWFGTISKDGKPQICYSIQIFDLLRLDILDAQRQEAILRRLNEQEFLSAYGVHSLSKREPGYDPTDVDWGGPGVYAGDAPELIQDLYHSGHPAQAGDLLRRILWWGQRMPYYPQAVRADKIDYRRDGRCNVLSGVAGAQMLIFGELGLEATPEGSISIQPRLPPETQTLTFEGVRIRNQRLDVSLDSGGCTVTLASGQTLRARLGQKLEIRD
ncbi:MAG: hypothetical protein NTX50_28760 [Candidatus Sumerlaeota bacterium]|nr:hypothetical protein [Candidatus Sumerlaeota bacterium]